MSAIHNSAGRVDEFTVAIGFALGHGVGQVCEEKAFDAVVETSRWRDNDIARGEYLELQAVYHRKP